MRGLAKAERRSVLHAIDDHQAALDAEHERQKRLAATEAAAFSDAMNGLDSPLFNTSEGWIGEDDAVLALRDVAMFLSLHRAGKTTEDQCLYSITMKLSSVFGAAAAQMCQFEALTGDQE